MEKQMSMHSREQKPAPETHLVRLAEAALILRASCPASSTMPAPPRAYPSDPTTWSMVAFLQKLPGMTPAQYEDIVSKAPPAEDMDMSHMNMGADHGGDTHEPADASAMRCPEFSSPNGSPS